MTLPLLLAINCSIFLDGVRLHDPLYHPCWDFVWLDFVSYGCCEFTCAMALLCLGNIFTQVTHYLWLLQTFYPLFRHDPEP